MVSTRHHPRPFPEPDLPPSRMPSSPTSTVSVSPPPLSSPTKRSASRPRSTKQSTSEANGTALTKTPRTARSKSTTRTVSRSRSRPAASRYRGSYTHRAPTLLIVWLLASLPLVFWDTLYVLGRPHTMPGGKFHAPIWTPYALYGTVDYVYGFPAIEANNGFTAGQGSLNALESTMYIWYLVVVWKRFVARKEYFSGLKAKFFGGDAVARRGKSADKIAAQNGEIVVRGGTEVALAVVILFSGAVMTLSKTVLYWATEYFSGFHNIGHNSWSRLIWLWIIPNGAWLIGPTYMIWVLGKEMIYTMAGVEEELGKED